MPADDTPQREDHHSAGSEKHPEEGQSSKTNVGMHEISAKLMGMPTSK